MNVIELPDVAPLKYDDVMLSDDALDAQSVVTNGCQFSIADKNFEDVDRMLITYKTNNVECTAAVDTLTKNADSTSLAAQFPTLPKAASHIRELL